MSDAQILVDALADPQTALTLDADGLTGLIVMARAEQLLGSLAYRLEGLPLPPAACLILADARRSAEQQRVQAMWEGEMARRALAPLGVPVVLLKGTAFAAAGLSPSVGRSIGDLDILVPRQHLDTVEAALLDAGWEWVKDDPYTQLYYKQWMHELPPLIHRERDRMIDVHHTILPLTATPTPDAAALIAASVPLENGLRILAPADMLVHAAVHLFADGDMAGGLRNLWDIDRLLRDHHDEPGFWEILAERARLHQVEAAIRRAVRQSHALYRTPAPESWRAWSAFDSIVRRRLLARDEWGRATRPFTRFGIYIRSHLLRMPPLMLARHLWIKAKLPLPRAAKEGPRAKAKGAKLHP